MQFQKFIDLLPYFGFQMQPVGDLESFHDTLVRGTTSAVLSARDITLYVPEGKLILDVGVSGSPLAESLVSVKSGLAGYDVYLAPLKFKNDEDVTMLVDFLLSGIVGAVCIPSDAQNGIGYVINAQVVRLMSNASEFLNEADLQTLLHERIKYPDDAILQNFIGKFCVELGQEGEAAGYFTDAAKLEPRFAEPHSNLGALMWRAGFKEKAFGLFSEALIRHPFNVDIQDNFIGTGLELGLHAKMKECLARIATCFPDYSGLLYLNALLSLNLGNQDECRGILNTLLKQRPGDERAISLLEELGS